MLHSNPGDYAWGQSGLDAIVTQVRGTCAGGLTQRGRALPLSTFLSLSTAPGTAGKHGTTPSRQGEDLLAPHGAGDAGTSGWVAPSPWILLFDILSSLNYHFIPCGSGLETSSSPALLLPPQLSQEFWSSSVLQSVWDVPFLALPIPTMVFFSSQIPVCAPSLSLLPFLDIFHSGNVENRQQGVSEQSWLCN